MSVRKVLAISALSVLLVLTLWGIQAAWTQQAQQVMRESHIRQIVTPFTVTRSMTTTVTVIVGSDFGFGNG